MPLTIVTGRANSGKTGRAYDVVRTALASDGAAVLLLPSAVDVTRARREFAREGAVGLRLSQFDRYLEDLWSIHGDGRRLVTEEQRVLLLRSAVQGRPCGPLEKVAQAPGLVRMLSAVVRRYPAAGVGERPSDTMRMVLVRILDGYRENLRGAGLVEAAEAFGVLGAVAPALAGPLVAHRFTDFTPQQEAFLVAQSATGTDVCVTLPHARGFVPTAALDGVVERFARVGEVVELAADAAYTPSAELARAEAQLFEESRPAAGQGDVRLLLSSGEEGEAVAIAAELTRLTAEGTRPESIAVVFRDPLRHLAWIKRALAAEGIAADYDMRVPLGRVPLGRALLHLLRFFSSGYQRRDLTAFLRCAASGADPAAADRIEARWRSQRLEEGPELVAEARACGRAVRRVLTVAARLAARRVDPKAIRDWQRLLDALFREAHPDVGADDREAIALDAAVHRVVLQTMDGMVAQDGARFADAVDVLGDLTVTPAQVERPGHVQVIDAERARFRRFDAMIIGGMTASEFPRQGGGDGFGSETVAAAGRLLGLDPTQGPDLDRERLLLYQLVTRARRTLILSRQEGDSEGRPLRGSVFWDEFLDLYRYPSGDDTSELPESLPPRVSVARAGTASAGTAAPSRRGTITDEQVLEALASRQVFSASDIEAYLGCPYRWFYERELRPRSLDPELDPRATGTLVHETLRLFYERLEAQTGSRRMTGDLLGRALELVDAAFSEAAADAPQPRDLAEEERIHRASRWARGLVRRDALFLDGWEPIALEWSFGRDDEAEAFEGFGLKGTVDRIDRGPEGLVVMDYKSSLDVPKRADLGGVVQIPLYVEVVRRRFGEPVVAGLYRSLSRSRNADRGFYLAGALPLAGLTSTDACADAEAFAQVVRDAELRAAEAVAGMRAGVVAQEPRDDRECAHCAARHGCGGPRT